MVEHPLTLILFVGIFMIIGYLLYKKKGTILHFEESDIHYPSDSVSSLSSLGFLERKSAREGVSTYGYTIPDSPAYGNLEQYVWTRFSPRLGLTFETGKAELRHLKEKKS